MRLPPVLKRLGAKKQFHKNITFDRDTKKNDEVLNEEDDDEEQEWCECDEYERDPWHSNFNPNVQPPR